jgi:hypothetical protein
MESLIFGVYKRKKEHRILASRELGGLVGGGKCKGDAG